MDKELQNISEVRRFLHDNRVFNSRAALSIFKVTVAYFSSISEAQSLMCTEG